MGRTGPGQSKVRSALLALAAVVAHLACAAGGGRAQAPGPDTAGKEARVCGLKLPCTAGGIVHSHDYYAFFRAAASGHGRIIAGQDPSDRGCVRCVNPAKFFGSLVSDPAGRGRALLHIIYAMGGVGRGTIPGGKVPAGTPVWSRVHRWAVRALGEAVRSRRPPSCYLVSTYCASTPAFRKEFRRFLPRILSNPPRDGDPGFAKEWAVKLAVFLDPKGSFPALLRFVKSGARVRARMKAVRDLCAHVGLPKVRRLLEWVGDHDPALRVRAQKCLRGAAR